MADELISRQALLAFGHATQIKEAVGNWHELDNKAKAAVMRYATNLRRIINNAPAVDAVPVVLCKDCKKNPRFSKTSGKHKVWCRKWRCEVKDTDFCSYGERREENAAD